MFRDTPLECPQCGISVQEQLQDGQVFECSFCSSRFKVLLDKEEESVAFIEIRDKEIPEPLFLPRGSIRASVTMLLAFACWILIFAGKTVPGYHLNLLLAIIGYYFGFRMKMKAAQSRIYDAAAREKAPLFMPGGVIRLFLVAGFIVTGAVLWHRGQLAGLAYLEFFVILSGLIVGFIFSRAFAGFRNTPFYLTVNHLKGAAVLTAAMCLVVLLLSGLYADYRHLSLGLSAIVTFYFGSRS